MRRITSSFTHMASLKNVRHEKFAQCVASGLSGADAYRRAAEYSGKQADGNAANWMKRSGVRERIEELKAEAADKCSLSREQALDWLASVIRTPAGQVTKDSPLCQSYKVTGGVEEIRMPDKIAAVTQIAKMCGWHTPDKIHLQAEDTLTAFMQSIRQANRHSPDGQVNGQALLAEA
jgi:hypothetical protein